jgi:hypothetical protein
MNKIFFDDPMVLFKKEEVFKIWPDPKKDIVERINASARFVIFVTCALYLYTRDTRIFVVVWRALEVFISYSTRHP